MGRPTRVAVLIRSYVSHLLVVAVYGLVQWSLRSVRPMARIIDTFLKNWLHLNEDFKAVNFLLFLYYK